jgi:hypothetical protein
MTEARAVGTEERHAESVCVPVLIL